MRPEDYMDDEDLAEEASGRMEDIRCPLLPRRRLVVPVQRSSVQLAGLSRIVFFSFQQPVAGCDIEASDFEHMGKALNAICQEINDTLLPKNAM